MRPWVHNLVYGQSGAGKSTYAATFPGPQLVFMFDPLSKTSPYLAGGVPSGVLPDPQSGIPWQEVYNEAGSVLRRIEYFLDANPNAPKSYELFLRRFTLVHNGLTAAFEGDTKAREAFPWQTLIFDSMTKLELMARKMAQYKLNPTGKDPRQWYAYSTEALEEVMDFRVCTLPCNAVVICHTDKEKEDVAGLQLRSPNLPGRLKGNSPASFGEFYHLSMTRDEKGNFIRRLQTRGDQFFNASTMIDAPNFCDPHYANLWVK